MPDSKQTLLSCTPHVKSGTSDFKLFFEGDTLYQAMLKSIATAKVSICMESYIFANDEVGWRFARALAERAAMGVDVYLHLDAAGFMAWGAGDLKSWLQNQGIQLRIFHRWQWRNPLRYNQRNHRKLLIIDDGKVYLGGFNIHCESSRQCYGDSCWRDTHVRINGAITQQARLIFDGFWNANLKSPPIKDSEVNVLLTNFNRDCKKTLKCLYEQHFKQAHNTLWVSTPYFAPDRSIQRNLKFAARQGVDVRILVPRKNNHVIVQWASRAAYTSLLEAGVRIYEYLPRMLHAKTAVVDGVWATVGTSNLDYRSLFVNHEINLITRDPLLCEQLVTQFKTDLMESEEVLTQQWAKRPWSAQVAEFIGWMARRWL